MQRDKLRFVHVRLFVFVCVYVRAFVCVRSCTHTRRYVRCYKLIADLKCIY